MISIASFEIIVINISISIKNQYNFPINQDRLSRKLNDTNYFKKTA